jgi:hypothetical protein
MAVTQQLAMLYRVRPDNSSAWADITIVHDGSILTFLSTSDYGTFSNVWHIDDLDPKVFLCDLDFEYAMKKLTGGKLYVPDTDRYKDEVKASIIESRRCEVLTRISAREAWDELVGIADEYADSGSVFFHKLAESKFFESVFCDFEGIPRAKKYASDAVNFWENIWPEFKEHLMMEMKMGHVFETEVADINFKEVLRKKSDIIENKATSM